jgi:exo-1,4-beta-D-glucosaminidase
MFEAVNHRLWNITSGFTQWKINSAWPDVQWQIFDWFLKPMVSYFFIKRANEPVHIQLGLLDPTVTLVNHSLEPRAGLHVRARVLDPSMRVLFEKQENAEAAANSYRDLFELPRLPNLPPVCFVRLDLTDAAGQRVSDNLYWFPAEKGGSLQALRSLPPVRLESSCKVENRGSEQVARVNITNPTSQIAFFVQLALARGRGGTEILPVLWEDNYFSLLPGECREIIARFAAADADPAKPSLEVGGWNVETDSDCRSLEVSPISPRARQMVKVIATIADTFLDGSRVVALWDDIPAVSTFAWARAGKTQTVTLLTEAPPSGKHELVVGRKRLEVNVQPE